MEVHLQFKNHTKLIAQRDNCVNLLHTSNRNTPRYYIELYKSQIAQWEIKIRQSQILRNELEQYIMSIADVDPADRYYPNINIIEHYLKIVSII